MRNKFGYLLQRVKFEEKLEKFSFPQKQKKKQIDKIGNTLDLTSMGLRNEDIEMLSKEIINNQNIKTIILTNNNFGNEGVKSLTESLKSNSTITEIDFGCKRIPLNLTIFFFQAYKHLFLLAYNYSNEAGIAILSSLAVNESLVSIKLEGCVKIKKEVKSDILKKLNQNKELKNTKLLFLMMRKRKECIIHSIPRRLLMHLISYLKAN